MDIIARVASRVAPDVEEDRDSLPVARVPGALVPVDAQSAKVLVAGSTPESTPKIARALLEEDDYVVSDANGVGHDEVQGDSQGSEYEIRMPIRAPVTADDIEESDPEDLDTDSGASYDTALERMAASSTISSQYGSPRGTPTGSIFGSEAGDSLHRRLTEVLSDEPVSNSLLDEPERGDRNEEQFRESGSGVHFIPVAKVTTDEDDQQAAGGSGYLFSDDEYGEDEPLEQSLETAAGLHVAGDGEDELIPLEGSQEVFPSVRMSQDTLADSVEEIGMGAGIPVRGISDPDELRAKGLPVAGADDAILPTASGLPIVGAGKDVTVQPSAQGLPIAGIEPTAEGLPVAGADGTAGGFPVAGAERTTEGFPVARAERTAEGFPVAGAERTAEGFPVAGIEEFAGAREEHSLPTAQGLPVVGAEEEFFAAHSADPLLRAGPAAAPPEGKYIAAAVAGADGSSRNVSRHTIEGYVSKDADAQDEAAPPDAQGTALAAARGQNASPSPEGLLVAGVDDSRFGLSIEGVEAATTEPPAEVAGALDPAVSVESPKSEGLSVASAEDLPVVGVEPRPEELSPAEAEDIAVATEKSTAETSPSVAKDSLSTDERLVTPDIAIPLVESKSEGSVPRGEALPSAREELTSEGFPVAESDDFAVTREELAGERFPVAESEDLAVTREESAGEGFPVAGSDDLTVTREEPTGEGIPVAESEDFAVPREEPTGDGFPVAESDDLAVTREEPTGDGLPVAGSEDSSVALQESKADGLPVEGADNVAVTRRERTPDGLADVGSEISSVALVEHNREGFPVAGVENVAITRQEPTADGLPDVDPHELPFTREEPTAEGLPVAGAEGLAWEPDNRALLTDCVIGLPSAGTEAFGKKVTSEGLPVAGAENSVPAPHDPHSTDCLRGEGPEELKGVPLEDGPSTADGLPVVELSAVQENDWPTAQGLPVAGLSGAEENAWPTAQRFPVAGLSGAEENAWPTAQGLPVAGLSGAEGKAWPTAQGLPVAGVEPSVGDGAKTLVPAEEDVVLPIAKEAHTSSEEKSWSAPPSDVGFLISGSGVAAPHATGGDGPDTIPAGPPGPTPVISLPLHGEKERDASLPASQTQHSLGDHAQRTSSTQSEIEDSRYEPESEASAADRSSSVKQVLGSAAAGKSRGGSGRSDGVVTPTGQSMRRNLAQLLYNEAAAEKQISATGDGEKRKVRRPRMKVFPVIQSFSKSAHAKAANFAKIIKLRHIPSVTCFRRKIPPVAQ